MIFIEKPGPPAWFTAPGNIWEKETSKAIAHYSNGAVKAFEFKKYNDPRLKSFLKQTFVKCAYCESIYGAVYDGDVEHFRPKGRIKEKNPQTPGYYWLANDWDNLLLSCQHCNQKRQHILFDEEELESYGKLDQFPLADENARAAFGNDLTDEERHRLLIHPCKDKNVEDNFEYEETEAVIRHVTPKGEKSIKVYVLQRPLLVQQRKEKLILLFQQIDRVKEALEEFNEDHSEKRKQKFDKELDILLSFGNRDREYAGMCRFFTRKFLKANNIEVQI